VTVGPSGPQQYIAQGNGWVIDLDLEKFFDRVNHDKLMGQIAKRIEDKRLLKLIRAFLNAGVMENGLVSPAWKELRKEDRFRHC
jgi:RNA-directed DNA polymerase